MERYMNQSVQRALSIVELVGEKGKPLNLREISEGIGLHKSTVHRLALTLESEGWLTRTDEGTYVPGLKLLTFSRFADDNVSSLKEMRPILQNLCKRLDEQVILSIWNGKDVICIDKQESTQKIQVHSEVGGTFPIYAGGTGLAVLIGMPENVAMEVISSQKLVAFTERTLTDKEKLIKKYKELQALGHVVSIGQVDRGVAGIAVPVYFQYEKKYGSIGVVMPETRATEELQQNVIGCLKDTIKQIHKKIGGQKI